MIDFYIVHHLLILNHQIMIFLNLHQHIVIDNEIKYFLES